MNGWAAMLPACCMCVAIPAGAAAAAPVGAASPVVLELFTSQSCSSCPPADALLGQLRTGSAGAVLPLSLHVDYWDRTGWRDRYSSAAFTARQYGYARRLSQDGVYTPELVVDGAQGMVGSDAAAVGAAIARAHAVRAGRPAIALLARRHAGRVIIDVGDAAPGIGGSGRLVLVGYDDRHITRIGGGENDGRTLVEWNVVRSLTEAASWTGAAGRVDVAVEAGEHQAVLLQAPDGRILAACLVDQP